jgi:glutathione synthase/RimK-type ligase-like ATP-grasp enzyme
MKEKIVLIITSYRSKVTNWAERERYVEEFYSSVEQMLDDTRVIYTTSDDIVTTVINNKVTMRDVRHDLVLSQVDFVHFKNWMFDDEHAALIAYFLSLHKISFFNEEVNAGLAWGKISQMCRLAEGGVPVPDTLFAKKEVLYNYFANNELPQPFVFPLIMKADDGAKGNDNHLVRSAEESIGILKDTNPEKQFVVQNFLPNDGDYRFLFAGTDNAPLVFLRRGAGDSHLNNTSQGGSGELIEIKNLPAEFLQHARSAARMLKREISGVDIIVDKNTQKPYVLEVNSTPALATGYAVEQKKVLFKNFIESQLQQQEEE